MRRWLGILPVFAPAAFGQFCGIQVIAGAPFSADQIVFSSWVNGKGGPSKPEVTRYYRDSAGRTRLENTVGEPPAEIHRTTVSDPIAGFAYSWSSESKFVRRFATGVHPPGTIDPSIPVLGPYIKPQLPPDSPFRNAQTKYELLGTQVLEGLTVEGDRLTTVWPPGTNHNDHELITGSERWVSAALRTNILTKIFMDHGERTCRLVDIRLAEPDADLFRPPEGYTIADEQP